MNWTREQALQLENTRRQRAVNIKSQDQATEKTPDSEKIAIKDLPPLTGEASFTVMGDSMGKPRMTQRDRWKKRPVVERYHDYCDRIKEAAPTHVLTADVYAIEIDAYIELPKSWSKKKRLALADKPCRAKPDWDNIAKGCCDALFEDDAKIADGHARKFWCWPGYARTEIRVQFYLK